MLLIYSHQITPRLQYTGDLLFRDLLEVEVEFTTSKDRFMHYEGPKINYSRSRLSDEIHIYPHGLLFERDIKQQRTDSVKYRERVALFSHQHDSDLPYDPFAASFFLVSRYEEYLEYKEDSFGRFRGEKSLAYSKGFHTEPMVNHYALHLKELLQYRYPGMSFSSKEYQFILTYDIDNAFMFEEKGFYRSKGVLLRAIMARNWSFIGQRRRVLKGLEKDPNDTFEEQFRLSDKYQVYPVYFFPVGNYSKLDKNIPWSSEKLKAIIKRIAERFLTGIHPSYRSVNKPHILEMEIARFNAVTGKPAIRSRQHYLHLKFPQTYRMLIAQGIQEDWTMGHATIIGFRASIASPFFFYDLKKEEQTNLRIYPFAAMDTALYHYQKLSPRTALEEVKQLVDEVKRVNGTFIFISHNDVISRNNRIWPEWNKFFEELIAYARE